MFYIFIYIWNINICKMHLYSISFAIIHIYIYLIITILGFHNCNFAYLPKFICNPKINPCSTLSVSFADIWKAGEILCCPMPSFSAEVEQGNIPPSCFSSPTLTSVLFMVYLAHFSHSYAFGWWFYTSPKYSAEVLSSVLGAKRLTCTWGEKYMCYKASFRHEL